MKLNALWVLQAMESVKSLICLSVALNLVLFLSIVTGFESANRDLGSIRSDDHLMSGQLNDQLSQHHNKNSNQPERNQIPSHQTTETTEANGFHAASPIISLALQNQQTNHGADIMNNVQNTGSYLVQPQLVPSNEHGGHNEINDNHNNSNHNHQQQATSHQDHNNYNNEHRQISISDSSSRQPQQHPNEPVASQLLSQQAMQPVPTQDMAPSPLASTPTSQQQTQVPTSIATPTPSIQMQSILPTDRPKKQTKVLSLQQLIDLHSQLPTVETQGVLSAIRAQQQARHQSHLQQAQEQQPQQQQQPQLSVQLAQPQIKLQQPNNQQQESQSSSLSQLKQQSTYQQQDQQQQQPQQQQQQQQQQSQQQLISRQPSELRGTISANSPGSTSIQHLVGQQSPSQSQQQQQQQPIPPPQPPLTASKSVVYQQVPSAPMSPLYFGHNPFIEILRPQSYADDNIVTLNLSHSHIYEIDGDAFVGQRFEHIDLSNNKLGLIHSRSFRIGPYHSKHSPYDPSGNSSRLNGNSPAAMAYATRRPPPAHPKSVTIDFSHNPAIVALSGAFDHIDVPNCLLNFTNSTVELKFGAFKKYFKDHPGHIIDIESVDCCDQEWLLGYKHNFVHRTHCAHDPNLFLLKVSQQTIIDSCIAYVTSARHSMTMPGTGVIQSIVSAPRGHSSSHQDNQYLTYLILGGTAMILTSLSIYIIFYMFSLKAAFVYQMQTQKN